MSESTGENFLKEHGLIRRISRQRQQLLGCLGCRWVKQSTEGADPVAYGFQISKCTGISNGVIYPLLQSLVELGVVSSNMEDVDQNVAGRPKRRLFSPADSALGRDFAAVLVPPNVCKLEIADSVQTPYDSPQHCEVGPLGTARRNYLDLGSLSSVNTII